MNSPSNPDALNSNESPGPVKRAQAPGWVWVTPFFISAFCFLSAIFSIFAPLPLILLFLNRGRRWAIPAAITNAAIVYVASGGLSLMTYSLFVLTLGLSLSEMLKRGKSLEKSATYSLLALLVVGAAAVLAYSKFHHVSAIGAVREQLSQGVDYLAQRFADEPGTAKLPTDMEIAEWKQSLIIELPSAVAIFALMMLWTNLLITIRINPKGIRERIGLDAAFTRKWKAPEVLVWPTIASGALLLKDFGVASGVALNVFKFLMAIYAIQGLSILSFFFDVWNIRGLLRKLGFAAAILVMMPLVLSLGFFDLWFDFRGKFRQS